MGIESTTDGQRRRQFEELLRPHLRAIRAYAQRLSGNADDAQDLVQDVLVKLYEKSGDLGEVDELRPWLMRVTYHRFVDVYRRREAQQAGYQHELPLGDDEFPDPLDRLASGEPGPDIVAERLQLRELLTQVMARLPQAQRQVLDLHHLRGLTLAEIAAQQSVSINTLKSSLLRALANLRSHWFATTAVAGAGLDRAYAGRSPGYGRIRRRRHRREAVAGGRRTG